MGENYVSSSAIGDQKMDGRINILYSTWREALTTFRTSMHTPIIRLLFPPFHLLYIRWLVVGHLHHFAICPSFWHPITP